MPSKPSMAWATVIAKLSEAAPFIRQRWGGEGSFLELLRPPRREPETVSSPASRSYEKTDEAGLPAKRRLFSPLTRLIVGINVFGLVLLVGGLLLLSHYRTGLVDSRIAALATEGELVANALEESALLEPEFAVQKPQFDLNATVPILRRMASSSGTRIRLYGASGRLLIDSRSLLESTQVQSYRLPPPGVFPGGNFLGRVYDWVVGRLPSPDLPRYVDNPAAAGFLYDEVANALLGEQGTAQRVDDQGQVVVSVAVPIQRMHVVQGAMLLTSEGPEIESILRSERLRILQIFFVALGVSIVLSILVSGAIGKPIRKLAAAADRVRLGRSGRAEIPTLARGDEIGDLAASLADMTNALYARMDATEQFAADVAHEIKNPLTSLRSAVETIERTEDVDRRRRLFNIIKSDVGRINRLITDISDASRLDAELTRERMEPVDIAVLLRVLASMIAETGSEGAPVSITVDTGARGDGALTVTGLEDRLAQVFRNVIDNARSFSPPTGSVRIAARREGPNVVVTVDDDGPGIPPENLESIFERFYTAREGAENFGKHSGLGLAIARQILTAHRGKIRAENRTGAAGAVTGARFVVTIPT